MISGVYEQCGVLFNIASLQAQIAKSQNFESDEGIKNACKHFQVRRTVVVEARLSDIMFSTFCY